MGAVMTSLVRTIALALALSVLGVLPASAQERTAVRQGFELEANSGKRILVFRPSIRVGSQSTAGMFEPNAEWTEQAKRNILGENARKLFNLEPIFSDLKLAAREAHQKSA